MCRVPQFLDLNLIGDCEECSPAGCTMSAVNVAPFHSADVNECMNLIP